MTRALLDVNVLLALLDVEHVHHDRASVWLDEHRSDGWASCPLTENGAIRIISGAAYPRPATLDAAVRGLRDSRGPEHALWPDDVSLLDPDVVDPTRVHGSRQLTDCYLLALAVKHSGRLVTLDRRVALEAVAGATSEHLVVL